MGVNLFRVPVCCFGRGALTIALGEYSPCLSFLTRAISVAKSIFQCTVQYVYECVGTCRTSPSRAKPLPAALIRCLHIVCTAKSKCLLRLPKSFIFRYWGIPIIDNAFLVFCVTHCCRRRPNLWQPGDMLSVAVLRLCTKEMKIRAWKRMLRSNPIITSESRRMLWWLQWLLNWYRSRFFIMTYLSADHDSTNSHSHHDMKTNTSSCRCIPNDKQSETDSFWDFVYNIAKLHAHLSIRPLFAMNHVDYHRRTKSVICIAVETCRICIELPLYIISCEQTWRLEGMVEEGTGIVDEVLFLFTLNLPHCGSDIFICDLCYYYHPKSGISEHGYICTLDTFMDGPEQV